MEKMAWDGPKWGREVFFQLIQALPTFWAERIWILRTFFFFHFSDPKFLDFQVPRFPKSGLGRAWALGRVGPRVGRAWALGRVGPSGAKARQCKVRQSKVKQPMQSNTNQCKVTQNSRTKCINS